LRILSELITRNVDNDRFVQLVSPFIFESDLLVKWGLRQNAVFKANNPLMICPYCHKLNRDCICVAILTGFVQDFESMPIVRGRNKRGGTVHDYFSCFDSDPVVTKEQAADLYAEMNKYTDSIDHGRGVFTKIYDWMRRSSKAGVVRIWPGFFHRRSVFATCKEIAGIDGDPYVTIEKIEAAIVQSEQATDAIKEVPAEVEGKPAMVVASEKVTADLKTEKQTAVDGLTG
jgi:hypothetical protein